MKPLESLIQEAAGQATAAAGAPTSGNEREVERILKICNACRYCEGFCAVFPAMTRRLEFGAADIHYLANLCHNCGACLHACQYAPPHEFAVNVPQAMARVRARTYADYAWPSCLGRLYRNNGLTLALALTGGLALFLVLALVMQGSLLHEPVAGDFYAIFPHNLLVWMFAPVFLLALLTLGIGLSRFWRDISPAEAAAMQSDALTEAASDVLRLKYLDGGHGEGCPNADDANTLMRRRFHHLTFYGFLLCFAATCVGTIYHYGFGWQAPYGLFSLPVVLGTVGGLGLLIGPAGLFWLHLKRAPQHGDGAQKTMDRGFMALLFLTSLTGLALLAGRSTGAMGLLLALHLGSVMALFLTMPYSKFAHGFYRSTALLKWAIERRRPNPVGTGND